MPRMAACRPPAVGDSGGLGGLRRDARPSREAHCPRDPDEPRHRERHRAQLPAAQELEAGHLLRDADLERVDRTERRADGRRAEADRHRDQGVEAEPAHEQQEHRNERDQLLLHLDQDPAPCEGEPHDRNHPEPPAGQPVRQPVDQLGEGAGPLHHRERPADEEHVEDDRRRVGHALGNGDQRIEGADRAGGHGVIGPGHHHLALRHRVLAPVVLPGREHPSEDGRDEDAEDEQDERVRKPQARRRSQRAAGPAHRLDPGAGDRGRSSTR